MRKIYFIADTHFGDDKIRRYENRPFADTVKMDAELIRRWNETVTEEDIVYHLGDFGGNGREAESCKASMGSNIWSRETMTKRAMKPTDRQALQRCMTCL